MEQCLTISFIKKFWQPEFVPNGPKSGPKLVFFFHFLEFGSYVFREIEYNDSLRQCLNSSRGKTHENLGPQIWAKRAKIGTEIRFFVIF